MILEVLLKFKILTSLLNNFLIPCKYTDAKRSPCYSSIHVPITGRIYSKLLKDNSRYFFLYLYEISMNFNIKLNSFKCFHINNYT